MTITSSPDAAVAVPVVAPLGPTTKAVTKPFSQVAASQKAPADNASSPTPPKPSKPMPAQVAPELSIDVDDSAEEPPTTIIVNTSAPVHITQNSGGTVSPPSPVSAPPKANAGDSTAPATPSVSSLESAVANTALKAQAQINSIASGSPAIGSAPVPGGQSPVMSTQVGLPSPQNTMFGQGQTDLGALLSSILAILSAMTSTTPTTGQAPVPSQPTPVAGQQPTLNQLASMPLDQFAQWSSGKTASAIGLTPSASTVPSQPLPGSTVPGMPAGQANSGFGPVMNAMMPLMKALVRALQGQAGGPASQAQQLQPLLPTLQSLVQNANAILSMLSAQQGNAESATPPPTSTPAVSTPSTPPAPASSPTAAAPVNTSAPDVTIPENIQEELAQQYAMQMISTILTILLRIVEMIINAASQSQPPVSETPASTAPPPSAPAPSSEPQGDDDLVANLIQTILPMLIQLMHSLIVASTAQNS